MPRPDILNWTDGVETAAGSGATFPKVEPAAGRLLYTVARSGVEDVRVAMAAARSAQPSWAAHTPVERGRILLDVALALRDRRMSVAEVLARETGRSIGASAGEVDAAVAMGQFMASEGQRLFGRTLTSSDAHRQVYQIRLPMGVAGLIVPANTPVANVAWKVFPALICGNAVVLKAAEDAPGSADAFARIAHDAGLPPGVLNVVHGYGPEAGAALVDELPDVISFTGSTRVGRQIAARAAGGLIKLSLELGGKNALVVCDDADMDNAIRWALLSSFSNAGQRCASSSRLIIFDAVYDQFRTEFVERTRALRIGTGEQDDVGPVISDRHLAALVEAIHRAQSDGAHVVAGGDRCTTAAHASGFYLMPTILDNVLPDAPVSREELFGPVTCLYRATDLDEAIDLVNRSPFGLTSAIHTASIHRAMQFVRRTLTGVTTVNRGTYGSEPHMPFGGMRDSGNGSREPGTEALEVYAQLKNVHLGFDPTLV